jgi:hypothetical protein
VALYVSAVLPFIYGLKKLARGGSQPVAIGSVLLDIALAVSLVRQSRMTHPLFDIRLFADRIFSSVVAIFVLVGLISGGVFLLINAADANAEPATLESPSHPRGLSEADGSRRGRAPGEEETWRSS